MLGVLVAWVLVRYEFPLKRLFDSLVDFPFALPTAVAGLVYSSLFVKDGWYGRFLVPLGIQGAYSRLGIVLVLVFIGFPFVVRTLQPVLEGLERDVEEASACLGANRFQTARQGDPAVDHAGDHHRLRPRLRAVARRVRLGGLHLGQHAVQDRDRAGARRRAPGGVRLRRGDRHRRRPARCISFVTLFAINLVERWSSRHHG